MPLLALSVLHLPAEVHAQWSADPNVNTPVALADGPQTTSVAASDGAGGAIVAWVDSRNPDSLFDIYAQRIDADGQALWTVNGVSICSAGGVQTNPAITSDGFGGAVIVWQDGRNPGTQADIWAQRVNAAGVPLWGVDGIPVAVLAGQQIWPMLVPDGTGGAIITWEDSRAGPFDYNIYAQRVSGGGAIQWPFPPGGVPICTADADQMMPMLVIDGTGGATITWYDNRPAFPGIYAQRVTPGGAVLWVANGVAVCGNPPVGGFQTQPTIAEDGLGGAIITWYDSRAGDWDVYAQRVNAAGALQWVPPWFPVGGVPVSTFPGNQEYPKIVSDGAGGAIITWQDDGWGPDALRVMAQHLDAAGTALWLPGGAPVCAVPGSHELPKIVSDGAGGAIIAWNDSRSGPWDIYAQRIGSTPIPGVPMWDPGGVAISTATAGQDWQFQFIPMVADGRGGAIITWNDDRPSPPVAPPDIYAQNVNADGSLGPRPLAFWRFEEGSGTTASDASGNGHTGTLVGTAQFVPSPACAVVAGRPDLYALNIDWNPSPPPPAGAVIVPDSPTLRPSDAITLEAWVRPSGLGGPVISKRYGATSDYSFVLFAHDLWNPTGGVSFSLCDASGVVTQVVGLSGLTGPEYPLQGDQWAHIAGTWDSATGIMRLYVDFAEVASASFVGPIGYEETTPVVVGGMVTGAPELPEILSFIGDLDEVRVFDRALSPAEMLRAPDCPLSPIIFLLRPTAGETVTGGSDYDITWTAIDDGGVTSITIEFWSIEEPWWRAIATGEPNDSVYTWRVPALNNAFCMLRITAYDAASNSDSDQVGFFIATPVSEVEDQSVPPTLSLAVHPNPSVPAVTVMYSLPAPGQASVTICDVQGRQVRKLVGGVQPAGEHATAWDGRDADGAKVPTGVYLVRLESGGRGETRKVVLLDRAVLR